MTIREMLDKNTTAYTNYKSASDAAVIVYDKERHDAWLRFQRRECDYAEYMAALDIAGRTYNATCDKAWAECTKDIF